VFNARRSLAPFCTTSADYFLRCPAILSADGTPLNKRAMRHGYGLKAERYGSGRAKRLLYREVFARARGFVAWSNWAKQSFIEDYGCREEDVAVISPGIDAYSGFPSFEIFWRDGPKAKASPPRTSEQN
jgi:hypothetical protein